MQQKIAEIEPISSAPVHSKQQVCLKQKQSVLQLQQPTLSVHPCERSTPSSARRQQLGAATAHVTEQAVPQDTGANSLKQPKTEKRRLRVAFGCCLPSEPSTVKCSAVTSKGCTSNTARSFAVADSAAKEPHDLQQFTATIRRSMNSSEHPAVTNAAAVASFPAASQPGCSDDVQPLMSHLSRPKGRVQQAQQWPRLELALHKYRQRKLPLGSCHKENHDSNGGANPAAVLQLQLLSDDMLPGWNRADAGGDSATGKSHSLALLGFSDSRTRQVRCISRHLCPHVIFQRRNRCHPSYCRLSGASLALLLCVPPSLTRLPAAPHYAGRVPPLCLRAQGGSDKHFAVVCKENNSLRQHSSMDSV
jgi:hypothetical protein